MTGVGTPEPGARSTAVCGRAWVCVGVSAVAPRSSPLLQAAPSPAEPEAPGEVWLTGPSWPVGGLGGGAGQLGPPPRSTPPPGRTPKGRKRHPGPRGKVSSRQGRLGAAPQAVRVSQPSSLRGLEPPVRWQRSPVSLGREDAGTVRERGATGLSTRGPWAPTRWALSHSPPQLCVLCSLAENAPPKRRGQGLRQAARARPGDVLRSQLPINYGWKQIRKSQFCMSRGFRGQRRPVAGSSGPTTR